MASELGGRAIPLDGLGEMLEATDIAISATGSPGYVLTPEIVAQGQASNGKPLFLIDIAVPRDVDPSVKALSGIHLYDIDDLEAVAETNRHQREREAQKVEAIVGEVVDRFMEWLSSLEVVPTVAALRERAESHPSTRAGQGHETPAQPLQMRSRQGWRPSVAPWSRSFCTSPLSPSKRGEIQRLPRQPASCSTWARSLTSRVMKKWCAEGRSPFAGSLGVSLRLGEPSPTLFRSLWIH